MQELIDKMSLMLDVFNSSIMTGVYPKRGSPCQKKVLELMDKAKRKPTYRVRKVK